MRSTIRDIIVNIKRDNIGAFAAQATLFILMSLIPFLLILLYVIRLTPLTEELLLSAIDLLAPETLISSLNSIVGEVYHNSLGILYISLVFAVFSAAKTIHSLQNGLNVVYGIEETRNWVVLRLWSVVETIILLFAIIVLLTLGMYGRLLRKIVVRYVPFIAGVPRILLKYRMFFLFFVLIIVLTWIYMVLPNRKASFRSQLPGAICCSIAWNLFSFFISIYINYFHGFSLYGSLTTMVITMFWLYVDMFIFLVCGEINNEFELLWLEYRVYRKKKKDAEIFEVKI